MAEDELVFEVAKRRKQKIPFRLEGEDHLYYFNPPKKAVLITKAMDATNERESLKAAFEWLDTGLSAADRDRIAARLRDPKDDLDIDTIEDIMETMMERSSGRPTT